MFEPGHFFVPNRLPVRVLLNIQKLFNICNLFFIQNIPFKVIIHYYYSPNFYQLNSGQIGFCLLKSHGIEFRVLQNLE